MIINGRQRKTACRSFLILLVYITLVAADPDRGVPAGGHPLSCEPASRTASLSRHFCR